MPPRHLAICVHIRDGARSRLGPDNADLPLDVRTPRASRSALLHTRPDVFEGLTARSKPEEFLSRASGFHGKVYAVMVIRAAFLADCMSVLDASQRDIREYWDATKYAASPLVFMEVVACELLGDPIDVARSVLRPMPAALVFEMTPFSAERVWASAGAGLLRQCRAQGIELADAPVLKAWSMPFAHALLVGHKAWCSYAFPFVSGSRARGTGIEALRTLTDGLDMDRDVENLLGPPPTLGPDALQAVADCIRANVDRNAVSEDAWRLAVHHVDTLQHVVDAQIAHSQRRAGTMYDTTHLLECLVFGGCLKSAADMADALRFACMAVAPDPLSRAHWLSILDSANHLPSTSTMYRHRLTAHVGFCRLLADLCDELVASRGFARYATMDASPQGHYEWLLIGATLVKEGDLVRCLRDANRLVELGQQGSHSDESFDEQTRIVQQLSPRLILVQAVPVGLGSGRCSLRYKMHALMHATRLTASSWPVVKDLLNGTHTWTGDLGVESRVVKFHGDMKRLMGDWISDG